MIKEYYEKMQLVLALSLYNKKYKDCNRKEKNSINGTIKNNMTKYMVIPYVGDKTDFKCRRHLKNFIESKLINKNGKLHRERNNYVWFLKNNFESEYVDIFNTTSYLPILSTIPNRIYHIVNDLCSKQECENIDCDNEILFLDYSRGYRRFCCVKCSKNKNELKKIGIYKEDKEPDFEKRQYYIDVRRYTRRTYNEFKHIINPDDLPLGRCGSGDVYQIDHIIPIIEGYNKKIDPKIMGNIKNLQILHWKCNLSKSSKYK